MERKQADFQDLYAGGLAVFLLAGNVCCLLFGHIGVVLSCNAYHAFLGFVVSAAGIAASLRGVGAAFNLVLALFFASLGITYFAPALRDLQLVWMGTNWPMAMSHIVIGSASFAVYQRAPRARTEPWQDGWAFGIGLFLALEGVWGFVAGDVLGVMRLNGISASTALALAVAGVIASARGHGRGFNLVFGAIFGGFGVLDLVPAIHTSHVGFLGVNDATRIVHLVLAGAALAVSVLPGLQARVPEAMEVTR